MVMPLATGDKAPTFSLTDARDQTHKISDFHGQWIVLYFYPKDDTPGCTKQACGFRDTHPFFEAMNTTIIGISRDASASHAKFEEKYDLPFLLLSDPDLKAANAYGVWQEKKLYGKISMGIVRSTFIIDPKGIIRAIFHKVRVEGHVEKVLKSLKELGAPVGKLPKP